MRQKKNRLFAFLIAVMFVLTVWYSQTGLIVYAQTLHANGNTLDISSDKENITFTYDGSWDNNINAQIYVDAGSDVNLEGYGAIIVNQGNDMAQNTITVLNSWYQTIADATGSVTNTNPELYYGYEHMQWQIKVPVKTYTELGAKELKLTWNEQTSTIKLGEKSGSQDQKATTKATTTTEKKEATTQKSMTTEQPTTQEVTTQKEVSTTAVAPVTTQNMNTTEKMDESSEVVVTSNLQIDGYYDDWKALPKTIITYHGTNDTQHHYGQLFTDGDRLYAHFKVGDNHPDSLKMNIWNLQINDNYYQFIIVPTENGNIIWDKDYSNEEGIHTNLKVYFHYGDKSNELDSQVAYTVFDKRHDNTSKGDEIEFSISLKKLAEKTGLSEDQMGTITIKNPNLGDRGITVAGTSTGPALGVALCVGVCAVVMYRRRRKTV